MQLRNHADIALLPLETGEVFQAAKGLCDIFPILNLECCKCARMIFHCANGQVVLCICTPSREH